jgi:rod shape-determining protein MreC
MVLVVLLTRNDDRISGTLLNAVNPIKQSYKEFTQGIEDKGQSYLFQKESIEKLSHENRILRKRLLEQMHYIEQVQNIYDVLPNLSRLPVHNISIAETISYVKLNSFSQITLTKPKDLEEKKLYGLIQGTVVAGVAKLRGDQLFGYLTSDDKCRFSVFIGASKAPGIAIGVEKNEMVVKFVPKWHNIKEGDRVITSGLDDIFFRNVPVGIVTKVEVQSAYTVAYIRTYNNILHPRTFFVVNNAKATLAENFDSNKTKFILNCPVCPTVDLTTDSNVTDTNTSVALQDINGTALITPDTVTPDYNQTLPIISSIPRRVDQTQEDIVEPEEPNEHVAPRPAPPKKKTTYKKKKQKQKKKTHSKSLDLF